MPRAGLRTSIGEGGYRIGIRNVKRNSCAGAFRTDMNAAYREDEEGFIFRAVSITALSCPLPKLCAIASRTERPFHTGRRCEKTDPL